jgi:hypothetical protein
MTDFWKTQKDMHKKLSVESSKKLSNTSLSSYKDMTKESYRNKARDLGDEHLIYETRFNKVYQNRNTGQITQAVSGSRSASDFINDGFQYLGYKSNPLHKKRYGESHELLTRLNSISRPRDVVLTGHSLGGLINNELIKSGESKKAINFNAFLPRDSINIDDERVVNVRNQNDFASSRSKHNTNTLNLSNSANPIRSHYIDELHV